MIPITIDGKKKQVQKGTTILAVAKEMGIPIPTLCFSEAMSPLGACRLCIVEATRKGRTKIVTACNYPITDEIEIATSSERILRDRRMIMRLLLARCPNVDELKRLGSELGLEGETRFKKDDEDCILCGHCVKVCEEVMGVGAIEFMNRGVDEKVDTPFQRNSDLCIGCQACASVCPTGAIRSKDIGHSRKMEPLHTSLTLKKCIVCGTPFACVAHVERLKAQLKLQDELFYTCPDCKRKFYYHKVRSESGSTVKKT
jgi:NADH dehydrogenase/NADH:ubiquinone oxidoreductase subunit G